MKLQGFFTGILLLMAFMSFGQTSPRDTLRAYYYKYPQEAIKEADRLYTQAIKNHNNPELIKSLILKTTYTLQIDRKDYPRQLKELEKYLKTEKDTVVQSILSSYIGQLYLQYYNNNRYTIDQRGNLTDFTPENMEEWSSNLFREKIFEYFGNSLSPKTTLQTIPVSAYNEIYTSQNYADSLRPTIYDFLAQRLIRFLPEIADPDRNPQQSFLAAPQLIAPLDSFLKFTLPDLNLDVPKTILQTYQDLLNFHFHANNKPALLMTDLERLEYAERFSVNPEKDSLYFSTLQQMEKNYRSQPMVIEIMANEANFLLRNKSRISPLSISDNRETENTKVRKEQALAICQQGIKLYPNYIRINLLHQIIQTIRESYLNISFPESIYPGEQLDIRITSQNLPALTLEVYRIDMSAADYLKAKRKDSLIQEQKIKTLRLSLPNQIVQQDTNIRIAFPQAGLYRIKAITSKHTKILSNTVVVSRLFTTLQVTPKGNLYLVRDWQSGKPIKNAEVRIYRYSYKKSYQLVDSVYTDPNGIASSTAQGSYYEAVNSENPAGILKYLRGYYKLPNRENNLAFITDRQIYRPGQTVFFKGIAWRSIPDSMYTLNSKKYEITFRNTHNKILSNQKFTTNEYGSFTGSFKIPEQTLNGTYFLGDSRNYTTIQVENYKRPEFEIQFEPSPKTYYAGDSVILKGIVKSFSGIALGNTVVAYNIRSFSRFSRSPFESINIQGVTQTNVQGKFEIRFKTRNVSNEWDRIQFYEITASVTDEKGETETENTTIPVYLPKTQPEIEIADQINKDSVTKFYVTLPNRAPDSPKTKVFYTLAKLVTPTQISEDLRLKDTIIEKIIQKGELQITEKDSLLPNLREQASGAYLFAVNNQGLESKKIFLLYSLKDKKPPIPLYCWLVEEKIDCRSGETAKVLLGTSAKQVYVTYEIHAGNRLIKRAFPILSNEIIPIGIPYKPEYGNEIQLTISYVKDKVYSERLIPIRKIRENPELKIKTKVFRDKLFPGQEEQWEIQITNVHDQGIKAEVLAMMYDASLDQLKPYRIYFNPRPLTDRFSYVWDAAEQGKQFNIDNLYSWQFPRKKYPIVPFRYPSLNTYGYEIVSDLMDFGSEELAESEVIAKGYNSKQVASRTGSIQAPAPPRAFLKSEGAMDTEPLHSVNFRKDFQETAFFYPQLQSDSAGDVKIKFKVPETTTKWKFITLAYTPQLNKGELVKYITTSKPLMVRPNLPRFFRVGDQITLKTLISNLSDSLLQGNVRLELFIPLTERIIYSKTTPFQVAANESQTINFNFDVPGETDMIGCRIAAANENFSDGEQHLIPILPNEILVTSTKSFYSSAPGKQQFSLGLVPSDSRRDYRLTLEVTANPIWYAVLALPSLTEPTTENITDISAAFYVNAIARQIANANPKIREAIQVWQTEPGQPTLQSKLEQNSELKSILLEASPWMLQAQNETEQMQTLSSLFDQNRQEYLQTQLLEKLRQLQTSAGGWSWFKGMPSSEFMTTNVLVTMARVNTLGQTEYGEQEKMMQIKALRYLDQECIKDFRSKPKRIGYNNLLYLYTRSHYRDIPLGEALEAHKYFMSLAQKQWAKLSLYEKAILALTFQRYGKIEDARNILKSLKQYAVTDPELGMYWPNNQNTFYKNSAVQVHTAIMEAFYEIEGPSPETELLKQWLLRQKQTQSWSSVPATVDAIHVLLLTGQDQLATQEELTVQIGAKEYRLSENTNPLGYIKKSFPASEITPAMETVTLTKTSDQPSWGGLYLQYFEKLDQIKKAKQYIGIDKKLFIEDTTPQGKTLIPLEKQNLHIGDKVTVRLTLSLNRDMEYLTVKDLRAACFEPEKALSGLHWKFGSVYYEDIKDSGTNLFFNALGRGTYVIEYTLKVTMAGEYQDGIATFQSMYAPEFNAYSEAAKITVNEK